MAGSMKKQMELHVDQYLSIYQECKKMQEQLDELREIIESYMKENKVDSLEGTRGQGKIELKQQERPIMNARYTTYSLDDISNVIPANMKKKCIVEVVDKDKLEALCKLGEVSNDILQMKQTKTSYSFNVRLAK